MKLMMGIAHRIGLGLLAGTLAGCTAFPSAGAADSKALPNSQAPAVQTASVTLIGELALFGAEMDAWLGVRDAKGTVTRLAFKSREEFAKLRQLQNQTVIVKGSPLPDYLGRPQVQVTSVQVQP